MADRTRPIRIEVCVTEQERNLIRHKMAQLGTRNMSAYFRKMAIDGCIINLPPRNTVVPGLSYF